MHTELSASSVDQWAARHREAVAKPRHGFEASILAAYTALEGFAVAHQRAYATPIGEDYVIGAAWEQMARALLEMLNGESGRLDCGTVDAAIRDLAKRHGVDLS